VGGRVVPYETHNQEEEQITVLSLMDLVRQWELNHGSELQ